MNPRERRRDDDETIRATEVSAPTAPNARSMGQPGGRLAGRSGRSYTDRTIKILWGRAAGRCAVPNCRMELIVEATDHDPVVLIGDIAHVEAASDRGPRANPVRGSRERDEYENLILLCKNCHTRLDAQKNTNTVAALRELKEDHEAWVRANLPEGGLTRTSWTAIILQGAQVVDLDTLVAAVAPDSISGDPLVVTARPDLDTWNEIRSDLTSRMSSVFESADEFAGRLAVFPLAPISACVCLGYLMTSRPRVELYQYHRDEQSWVWPDETAAQPLSVRWAAQELEGAEAIAICFELTARVTDESITDVGIDPTRVVRVSASAPGSGWLCERAQLRELAKAARQVFETCSARSPNARWHLFFAGPAPAAVVVGQQISTNMSCTVVLYEFNQTRRPRYQTSLTLNEVSGDQ